MQKLKPIPAVLLIFLFYFNTYVEAAAPSKIIRRQDTPFGSPEAGDFMPNFGRGLNQNIQEIQEWINWGIVKGKDKLVIKKTPFGAKTLTKLVFSSSFERSLPKNSHAPKIVDYVGYYELNGSIIEGYCIIEPVFRSSNPEIDSLTDLPEVPQFLTSISIQGRPIQLHYYEKKANGLVEAYLTAELFGQKLLLLDCLISANIYESIKTQVAIEITQLLDDCYAAFGLI